MASGVATPTKKRFFEDEHEHDEAFQPGGSRPKRSKFETTSTNCDSTNGTSCDESSWGSDSSGEGDGNGTVLQALTHRYHAPIREQFNDETSSDGETVSSTSSSSSSGRDSESESHGNVNRSTASNIVFLPRLEPRSKPTIRRFNNSSLRNKLASFLPELKAANKDLEKEIAAGNVARVELDHNEDAEVDGEYIEMNLGLGVLEEQADATTSDTNTDSESPVSTDGDNNSRSSREHQPKPRNNTNVLNKLMGNKPDMKRPTIEELPS
ncbi:hypothetical protein PAAG_02929 [Paracoccidioides lutzii Pb01]|uniref:Uncharacterized protein n=1 Tax=Paracoccidioides lutzii (strain ATCC MYA-826 / Pb01) TaxID=502779 RepID=C1GWN4_PARBA|nr:hypothetical protein PAAG_02929 [Paracoccidioides lutzii Pb01]EEH40953.1 hypothetical protein PAAG_02929 [Paracoccidioides lutzii Pb01]